MNIMDAVRSNKPFKRKHWNAWYTTENLSNRDLILGMHDILTEDWEVEDKKITITESEFDGIVEHILAEWLYSKCDSPHRAVSTALADLKKELRL